MGLTSFNIIELSTACVTIAGGIALILKQVQQSRCKNCNFCYLIKCERELPDIENQIEKDDDKDEDETKEPEIPKVEIPKVDPPKVKFPK